MRSSKGFVLQPLQGPGTFSDALSRPSGALPSSVQFDSDRLVFLEDENMQLKQQLREANELIAKLREENKELTEQVSSSPTKRQQQINVKAQDNADKNSDGTFVTRGAEDPEILCDNCSKQVAKKSFQLHYNYCVKNIQKCPFCQIPVAKAEMVDHLEQSKGTQESAKAAAENGDFESLQKMEEHGADLMSFKDQENSDNSLLHFAVKSDNLELLKFLKGVKEVNLDLRNANGETALHLCCGQSPNADLAKFLVLSGASTQVKNALGDTPITLATRFGHAELAMLLNTSDQLTMMSSPNSMSNKPPKPNAIGSAALDQIRSPGRDIIFRKKKTVRRGDSSHGAMRPPMHQAPQQEDQQTDEQYQSQVSLKSGSGARKPLNNVANIQEALAQHRF